MHSDKLDQWLHSHDFTAVHESGERRTILLDAEIDNRREKRIRSALEADSGDRVSDLHIWKVGPVDYAVIAALVTHEPGAPDDCKARLEGFTELSHITVEVNRCPGTG